MDILCLFVSCFHNFWSKYKIWQTQKYKLKKKMLDSIWHFLTYVKLKTEKMLTKLWRKINLLSLSLSISLSLSRSLSRSPSLSLSISLSLSFLQKYVYGNSFSWLVFFFALNINSFMTPLDLLKTICVELIFILCGPWISTKQFGKLHCIFSLFKWSGCCLWEN